MGDRRVLAAFALAVTLLSGCAKAVPGEARANQQAADAAMAAAYERGIAAFQAHFRRLGDERAAVYNYLVYGDTKRTNEFESAKVGDPPATLLTKRRDESDDPVTWLHPAGAEVDYVRLDRGHAHLAPTPWVSLPTLYPKDLRFDPHLLLTSWVAVKLDNAISETKLTVPDRQPHTVRPKPDGGFELQTGATLEAMIEEGIASVPDELKSQVTPEMKATVLPVRMDFGPHWEFRAFEVRATVPGDPQLQIQIGYEVTGTASKDDFPAPPQPAEVTPITDKAAVQTFQDELSKN